MAVSKEAITTTWAAISSAGEEGTCWLPQHGMSKSGAVLIYHSATGAGGAPTGNNNMDESYLLDPNINYRTILTLGADSTTDIYYARTVTGTQDLIVDVS